VANFSAYLGQSVANASLTGYRARRGGTRLYGRWRHCKFVFGEAPGTGTPFRM